MSVIEGHFRNIIRRLLRIFSRIFFLFPIKNGRIVFTALDGKTIGDNPKNIYDFLEGHYLDQYEYIWIYNGNPTDTHLSDKVKVIKRRSLKWFYYIATAQVLVDDWPPSFLIPPRKKQLYIETWHAGGAYKKIGAAHSKTKSGENFTNKKMNTVDIFVSSSEGFTKGNIEEGYQYKGEILNCGMPRNDVFFDQKTVKSISNKVKRYYSLRGKVILYAPTFRGSSARPDEIDSIIDMERLRSALKTKYNTNIDILVRLHPLDKHDYNFGNHIINVGDYPDMQELLCATDILITDYSSSMWDFALLGRPCLLYTPDIDLYIKDRGFFTPPEQWPGIICRSMDELCSEIKNLDEKVCAAKAKQHLEFMESYETGHATEIISQRIVDYINGD